ncbi:PREDICTED: transmembrane emp24 domain-containing protein p24delta4-like [Populus euphratica]|uniref:Transmembrane emp24 domain-containing protein p24delta4-like n=1 Tax=Populus euphratica TaxID=75702 RepID=A0AAJ6XR16_POPEU|nr:PREDICTED: transmembrane emp24 domain-containing protein p24delta4-like [Populus euphratica]
MMARNCDSRAGVTALSLILLCLAISNNIVPVPVAEAIWLSIPNSGTKCVSEEIQNDVVVLADYYVLNEEHPDRPVTVTVRVRIRCYMQGVELEVRKLKDHAEAIHNNLLYLKQREADMREVSEKTNSRVAWFSIMSLGVCIVVSVLQLWHLKRYFQKKKLI